MTPRRSRTFTPSTAAATANGLANWFLIPLLDGPVVRIRVGMAEHKTWWRNFEDPRPLRLRLAGVDHEAVAHVVRDNDRVSVLAELRPPADLEHDTAAADRQQSA